MTLEEIESRYDFTESTVHDIYWENAFKDLVMTVNYYWEDSTNIPARQNQFLSLRFINCQQIFFMNDETFFKVEEQLDSESISREPQWGLSSKQSVVTIIGWGDVRTFDMIRPKLQSPEDSDVLHMGFQSMHNSTPVYWLEVICSEMEVLER
jgi:hypothetical protein